MTDTKGNGGEKPTVVFDYLKSPQFRTVFAAGMIGGITPDGHIHFSLFNERSAIPRQMVYRLTEQGTLGEEIVRTPRFPRGHCQRNGS